MADSKITGLTTLSALSSGDYLPIVDVLDTTQAATGTTKKVAISSIIDTDGTLAANSDTKIPSQKAVKTYADTKTTLATVQQDVSTNYGMARQAIMNGNFVVNQRVYVSGATLAVGAYGHDRWKAGASGGDYTFTQLASSTQITIASGKSLIQVIEDKNVVGGNMMLSWTGTAQARVGINSATPSGSYASSPIAITTQTAGTVMSVEFNTGTLGKVIVNSGTVALPFQPKSYEEELRACQRYYETGFFYAAFGNITTTIEHLYSVIFKVTKRVAPTVVDTNLGVSNFGTTPGVTTTVDTGYYLSRRTSSATASNGWWASSWTASAEL